VDYCKVALADGNITDEQTGRVSFVQGDACSLRQQAKLYDLIIAANLLDLLRETAVFLKDIAPMIRSGGLLMPSSPYTWQEEYTPKQN